MHRTAGPCLVRRPCGFSLCSAHLADPPTFRLWGALIALVTCQTKVVHQCCPRQQAPSPAAVEVCHSSLHTAPRSAVPVRIVISTLQPTHLQHHACILTGGPRRRRGPPCAFVGACVSWWPPVPWVGAPLERGPSPKSWATTKSPTVAGARRAAASPTTSSHVNLLRRCGTPSWATWNPWQMELPPFPSVSEPTRNAARTKNAARPRHRKSKTGPGDVVGKHVSAFPSCLCWPSAPAPRSLPAAHTWPIRPSLRQWGALIVLVTCQTKVVYQCCPRQQAPSPAAVEVCHSSLHTSCSVLRLSQACSTQRRMLLVEPALPASAEVS